MNKKKNERKENSEVKYILLNFGLQKSSSYICY